MAKLFQTPPSNLLRSELQEYCEESENVSLKRLSTEAEIDRYLTALESNGRMLMFSQFPSCLFHTDKLPLRQAQFNLPSFENREYYTLDVYLNFLFAVADRFSLPDRIIILDRYIDYFDTGKRGNLSRKHIVFFSQYTFSTLNQFTNVEFFPKQGLIIMRVPILQDDQEELFLEIRNKCLCSKIYEFCSEQIQPIANPLNLLKVGRRVLQMRLEKIPIEEAIKWFYPECIKCMPDSDDPMYILGNFSPEIQSLLSGVVV
jgi:hypothetical protein